jgi:hypothetical protein
MHTELLSDILKGRRHLVDVSVEGRMDLKQLAFEDVD